MKKTIMGMSILLMLIISGIVLAESRYEGTTTAVSQDTSRYVLVPGFNLVGMDVLTDVTETTCDATKTPFRIYVWSSELLTWGLFNWSGINASGSGNLTPISLYGGLAGKTILNANPSVATSPRGAWIRNGGQETCYVTYKNNVARTNVNANKGWVQVGVSKNMVGKNASAFSSCEVARAWIYDAVNKEFIELNSTSADHAKYPIKSRFVEGDIGSGVWIFTKPAQANTKSCTLYDNR